MAEQRRLNSLAAHQHLILRTSSMDPMGPVTETHLHPESRHWFIPVPEAGKSYVAELGYYRPDRLWVSVALSLPAETPPDAPAEDVRVVYAAMPPLATALAREPKVATPPTSEIDQTLPATEQVQLEAPAAPTTRGQTAESPVPLREPDEESLLAYLATLGRGEAPEGTQPPPAVDVQPVPGAEAVLRDEFAVQELLARGGSSAEIAELLRQARRLGPGVVGQLAARWRARQAPSVSSPLGAEIVEQPGQVTSPAGGVPAPEARPGFWFAVNAELVIYGATEPDARVEIGGREIRLRPDGSFSYRFSLPDGEYELPAVAVSARADDCRFAVLRFKRRSEYGGEVGDHPQETSLRPPSPEHLG